MLGPLQCLLHNRFFGFPTPSYPKVKTRPHFLDLDAWNFLTTPLRLDKVRPEVYLRWWLALYLIADADRDDVLQTCNIDIVHVWTAEKIEQQTLSQGIWRGDRAFERRPREVY